LAMEAVRASFPGSKDYVVKTWKALLKLLAVTQCVPTRRPVGH
jgi:hypothetical protein